MTVTLRGMLEGHWRLLEGQKTLPGWKYSTSATGAGASPCTAVKSALCSLESAGAGLILSLLLA